MDRRRGIAFKEIHNFPEIDREIYTYIRNSGERTQKQWEKDERIIQCRIILAKIKL